ncbi:MAG: 4-amino-4-deoxychorismate lyase [Sulfurimonas sp.]|jgi:4-amino-4-deoxychorismate lyase
MNDTFLETIKAVDGEISHLSDPHHRYERVLKSLNVSNFKSLNKYLNPPKIGLYRCRLTYDSKNIEVSYYKYKKREINSLKLIYDDKISYSKKTSNRDAIDKLFDMKEACDDILIIKDNLVCDTSIANVAFYSDGLWFTPLKPLLKGTTRQRLLDNKIIIEKDIRVEEIENYSKMALMNAMIDFDIITKYNLKDIFC